MNGCSFQHVLRQNLNWFLSYHWKKIFLRGFILKPTERAYVLPKSGTSDFQNSPPLERSPWVSVTISEKFKHFQYLTLKQILWKTKTFFKKLEYLFLVESTKIENTSFPYKTALTETSVKTNGMVTTKWTFHKLRSFSSNYFVFLKILFQFKNLL